jgi:predicted nucleic acid-binding protein
VGGEDRPISTALLKLLDYICPNESELARLTGLPTGTEEEVLAAAASLTARGARNVLVTLGPRCVLLLAADGSLLRQEALPLPGGGAVVDATAAGDAFRAAFAVALVEGRPLQACLQLASAAGAVAVSRMGAVPSLPTRAEAEAVAAGGAGGTAASGACSAAAAGKTSQAAPAASEPSLPPTDCPYQFASRLNSMQARRDLVGRGDGGDDVLGWIACQSRIRGLSLVDLNHPQHTAKLKPRQLHAALAAAGLAAGAIAMRFTPDFSLGAFSNPDAAQRARAVALAAEGCRWAAELGARDLIVWPQYDGYDYNFQVGMLVCVHSRSFYLTSTGPPAGSCPW